MTVALPPGPSEITSPGWSVFRPPAAMSDMETDPDLTPGGRLSRADSVKGFLPGVIRLLLR